MRIKHIFLQNFCKFYGSNVVDTDLYDRTEISGVNEVGDQKSNSVYFWMP